MALGSNKYGAEASWLPVVAPESHAALARAAVAMMEAYSRVRPFEPLPIPEQIDALEDEETREDRTRTCFEMGA